MEGVAWYKKMAVKEPGGGGAVDKGAGKKWRLELMAEADTRRAAAEKRDLEVRVRVRFRVGVRDHDLETQIQEFKEFT